MRRGAKRGVGRHCGQAARKGTSNICFLNGFRMLVVSTVSAADMGKPAESEASLPDLRLLFVAAWKRGIKRLPTSFGKAVTLDNTPRICRSGVRERSDQEQRTRLRRLKVPTAENAAETDCAAGIGRAAALIETPGKYAPVALNTASGECGSRFRLPIGQPTREPPTAP